MANTYKDIIIAPSRESNSLNPNIEFRGGNTTSNTIITLNVLPDSNGTLSFTANNGQLFSITNDLTGIIFSVADISGIPYLEVDANGFVELAAVTGNVGVGETNTTNINTKFYVNGTIYSSNIRTLLINVATLNANTITANTISANSVTSVTFNSISDREAKENIRELGYGLNEVLQIEGRKFEMRGSHKTSIGFIAQELEKIIPEVVLDQHEQFKGVNYGIITAVLVEAIKDLNEKIEKLEKR